jgi:predicted MFS family arabinose efflux permease
MFYAGWCIAGLAMALTLYDPAFSTLSQHAGTSYRRALTALTLIAGFASTVFWPASVFLLRELDWRGTLMVFACIHLLLCLPIHLLVIPAHAATIPVIKPPPVSAAIDTTRRATFLWLALAFGLNAVIFSAMSAHLVGLLHDKGLSAEIAVTVAACIGPMQVAGRIVEMVFGRHWSPIGTGFFALGLLSVSLALLYLIGSSAALAFVFAVAYGWSNGILTIVRGTVPAELLGREAYGHLLGRLARATYLSQAVAPVAFALVLSTGAGYGLGVLALLAVALATLIAYFMATRRNLVSRRPQSVPIN